MLRLQDRRCAASGRCVLTRAFLDGLARREQALQQRAARQQAPVRVFPLRTVPGYDPARGARSGRLALGSPRWAAPPFFLTERAAEAL